MIDFKGMKKVSETPHKATFQHPAGHKIHIAKAALHPEVQKQISAMPIHNFDQGGPVSQSEWQKFQKGFNGALGSGSQPAPQPSPQPPKMYKDGGKASNDPDVDVTQSDPTADSGLPSLSQGMSALASLGTSAGTQAQPSDAPGQIGQGVVPPGPGIAGGPFNALSDATGSARQELAESSPATASSPAPDSDQRDLASAPQAPVDPDADIKAMRGGPELLASEQMKAKAIKDQSDRNLSYQHLYEDAQNKIKDNLQQGFAQTTEDINKVTQDIMSGHINPNHYVENMSAGSKIATAIGLILGGVSSARNGGPNPALQFLQSQIQRDLESQKANIDNKQTLLGALERQYNNKAQAAHMFAAIDANVLASKLDASASQAMNPMAQAALLQAKGSLKQTAAQYQQRAMLAGVRGQLENTSDPKAVDAGAAAYQNFLRQSAAMGNPQSAKELEDFQKHYIPSVGIAKVPLDDKDREFIQKNTALRNMYQEAIDIVKHNKGFGLVPGSQEYGRVQALQKDMGVMRGELVGLSRLTGIEHGVYEEATPDLTGTHYTNKDLGKANGQMERINNAMNSFYQQKGINRQSGDTDRVTVIGPNGKSYGLPASQLQSAVKQGYKLIK